VTDTWQPAQYERFADERSAPFFDLAALVGRVDGGRLVDLGCGTGSLTARLPDLVGVTEVLGVDRSPAMLEQAVTHQSRQVRFAPGDLATFHEPGAWDVVLANASLHWVPDHADVLARWRASLRADGWLAVQVPANADHPAHQVATEVGGELLGAEAPPDPVAENVLSPDAYATILDELGATHQHVRLQVYGHHLASTADVVEWMKGTSLTRFRAVLDAAGYGHFLARYRARLLEVLGERSPYFYPFKRILFAARFA
jgi:trans-aconitate 2-methyltransferase